MSQFEIFGDVWSFCLIFLAHLKGKNELDKTANTAELARLIRTANKRKICNVQNSLSLLLLIATN